MSRDGVKGKRVHADLVFDRAPLRVYWELTRDVSVAPSGTSTLVSRFRRAGAHAMSLSLDSPGAVRHDGFRGVPGCCARPVCPYEPGPRRGLSSEP